MPIKANIEKLVRQFLPKDFKVTDWESVKPFFQHLIAADLSNVDDLKKWLKDKNELSSILLEDLAWRYIRMTCNSSDEGLVRAYQYYLEEILPPVAEYENKLQQKYYHAKSRAELTGEAYSIMNANVLKDIEIFRQENVSLISQIQQKAQEYSTISGEMSIQHEGKSITLQQAAALLQSPDRSLREQIFKKISERRLKDESKLNELFDQLTELRTKVAQQADFKSYSDYRFKELGRFDYTREDCYRFHDAVERIITPIYNQLLIDRQQKLQLERLRPWDLKVDLYGAEPLKPFLTGEELVEKTIVIYDRMHQELGKMISYMRDIGHFDVSSRIGKAPGGYNYPLYESGVPFIFMNAVGMQSDLKTMVHECGHAIHAFLTHDLELIAFKDVPSEVAELASMSMELITMDYWDEFYTDEHDLNRAKLQQIISTVSILPWIATVDAFQQWLYDHPDHSHQERNTQWIKLYNRFHGTTVDWSELDAVLATSWHHQLHIFEVPFYYIEYGIAQLGALQVWQNYKKDPNKALENYLNALQLGYTVSIPKIYNTAGVSFNFSSELMESLSVFIQEEVRQLQAQLA